jgi:hypothetical protein
METIATRKKKEALPSTLNKPVAALAIVPLNRNLTVTARKAYNVMLHIAQREGDTGDAGFSAPLNAILRGFGVGNNVATDAKRYIDQMTSTKIEWRPLSEGEQWLLPLDEATRGADGRGRLDAPTDELRMFHMLSEVRLYKKGGENWVTWFYPPTIKEQMLGPQRWARLELEVIARLSTYTAVALYEICARYRDNPGGVTSRHACDWWVSVLKGSEGSKQREWRKFKNEFVNPAIKEIGEVSDIEIELIEYKQGRAIADVQFGVRKKPANAIPNKPEPPDVTNLLSAARLGVREADAEALLDRYGEAALTSALAAMERQLAGSGAKPILNRTAYLKTILAGQASPAMASSPVSALPVRSTEGPPPAPQPRLTTDENEQQALVLAHVRRRFEALGHAEQAEWIRRLKAHVLLHGPSTPTIVRRLDAGQWQSPLVTAMMMRFYAEQTYGPAWDRLDAAQLG